MKLSKEAYQALEDIVGPDNVSDDPAIMDSYAYSWFTAEVRLPGPYAKRFMPRPIAAILPKSTEEVQAIVKACNRYKIKYKTYSTGWTPHALPQIEGVLQLDMRRMNRILEIDERNMFAVIEPYVITRQLQAEAMKVGLNTHIIGAGASCSPLASATSYGGPGPDSSFMGYSCENLLAAEWVMPNGDIMRTGSLGSGDGWFCGEGIGPSLRGIARGARGASGGSGVYTKCAIKLYPWPGPAVMPIEGTVPAYKSPLPENLSAYTLGFPTWQAWADSCRPIWDNEIGYIVHRQFMMWGEDLQAAMVKILTDPTKTINDLEELLKEPEIQKMTEDMKRSFEIVLAGMTQRDIEYQEKVLNKILADTGGHKVAAMAEPETMKWMLLYLITLCFKNLNFVYVGGYTSCFAQNGTPDFVIKYAPVAAELKREHAKQGKIVDDGGDAMMGGVGYMGGGGACSLEQFTLYDPTITESCDGAREYLEAGAKVSQEMGIGGGFILVEAMTEEERQAILAAGPQPAIYHWQRKIKQILDPNDTGDGSYLWLNEPEK